VALRTSSASPAYMAEKKDLKVRCAECRNVLDYGADVLVVTENVIGPRGLVVVSDEPMLFCSDECLGLYFSDPVQTRARRIP
jgi:hypothetical protein